MTTIRRIFSNLYYTNWLPRKYGGTLSERMAWFQSNLSGVYEEIESLRWALLSHLLSHAERYSPYYRKLFKDQHLRAADLCTPAGFERIPLLTREHLQKQFEELVSEMIARKTLIRSGTSGSTGKPTPYYQDQEYHRQSNVLAIRNLLRTGWQYGEPIAKVWGSPHELSQLAHWGGKVSNYLRNITIYPAYEMNSKRMLDWLKQMQDIRPAIIEGYTNALVGLVRFGQEQQIPMHTFGVKAVVCSAEMLFPWQRQVLAQAFGCQVYNRYGCRELSTIAHECSYGRMHINEDWVYLEITDGRGQPLPAGETGQIVLSGYFTEAMPFIRYAIEDIGALSPKEEPCPCGCSFRSLERLEGRVHDLIVLPQGGYVASQYFSMVIRQFDVSHFRVVQPTIDKVEVSLVVGTEFQDEHLNGIRLGLSKALPGIEVTIFKVVEIPTTPSGKFRFTISHVQSRTGLI
jgi:phenylacetate-CoA ligase